jgi:hypothetical protein|tara:strand:+ start:936 stop:1451 length:516 start_codon:yes stop_codon:yes gene_type:complete
MTKSELRAKIKVLAKRAYQDRISVDQAAVEYDELTKFPELKDVIVALLGPQFDLFIASIDWVAPKPTTFRINLKNNENFYLVYTPRTFIAEIEGKKYYLLNLNEQENAENAIARMLRYGAPDISGSQDAADFDTGSAGGDFPEDTSTDVTVDAGGGDEVEVDTTTDVEAEA